MSGFEAIQSCTNCVFAPTSAILVSELPVSDDPFFHAALRGAINAFRTSSWQEGALDGWVLALPDSEGSTIQRLAATLNNLLRALAAVTGDYDDCFAVPIEHPNWHYQLFGSPVHVLAFGSCYRESSSRYSFGAEGTYLLLQPDQAFERRVPAGAQSIPAATLETIAARYAAAGRPYDVGLSRLPFQAYKFIKPLETGEPVVRWWEASGSA